MHSDRLQSQHRVQRRVAVRPTAARQPRKVADCSHPFEQRLRRKDVDPALRRSSRASGKPSSIRQRSTTCSRFEAVSRNVRSAALAREVNSSTAGLPSISAAFEPAAAIGNGASRWRFSSGTASGARLVTISRRFGQPDISRSSTTSATASSTCSALSTTSTIAELLSWRARSAAVRVGAPRSRLMAATTALTRSLGGISGFVGRARGHPGKTTTRASEPLAASDAASPTRASSSPLRPAR